MIVLLISLLICSCSSPFGINIMDYEELTGEEFSSWQKTASFSYLPEVKDYWKSPIEFESDGGGDCEDFSIYLVYLLGKEASVVSVKINGMYHSIVSYRGYYLEPQKVLRYYRKDAFTTLRVYSYAEAMRKATRYGTKEVR